MNNAAIKAAVKHAARRELAKTDFMRFVKFTKADYETQWFHLLLAWYLQEFAEGRIKKLMIFMPPQHGKSQLVSRHLPAFLLGLNPKLKIVGSSYSSVLSSSFNRDVQRIIDSSEYREVFPSTQLNSKNVASDAKGSWLRNSEIFEIVGHGGFYKSVGVGGSLTGTPADIGIIDDPVKDASDADSATIRASTWDWYESVFSSRLHNKSQVLLTMTRWHRDDLAGRILASPDAKNWVVLKLPAIKTEITHHPKDLRQIGEALWEERHSAEKIKNNSARVFEALYQQNPQPPKGGLVFPDVAIIDTMPPLETLKRVGIGMDFGYSNDPTAATICGIDEKTRTLYLDQLIYDPQLSTSAIAARLKGFENLDVFCDHDVRIIDELRQKYGFRKAQKATKGAGSIQSGIKLLTEWKLCVTKRSFGAIQEQQKYVYKTDGYGLPTDEPIDDFNHFWDAARYYAAGALTKPEKRILGFSKR